MSAVTIQSGSRYVFINRKGGTAIDLSGEDNKSIIGYPRHGGENQQWEITRLGDEGDKWVIKNVRSGEYLGYEGEPEPGRLLVATKQLFAWGIEQAEPNTPAYRISVPNTNQNVDLSDYGNSNPGTPIAMYGRWEGINQVWLFEKVQ